MKTRIIQCEKCGCDIEATSNSQKYCIPCAKERNREYLREYLREYRNRPEAKKADREYEREYRNRPEVKKAIREYQRECQRERRARRRFMRLVEMRAVDIGALVDDGINNDKLTRVEGE